jgi:hypothetical protein
MSNDPLALSDIFPGLPKKADYETVYAAVMATERGRQFLTEFANRNRQADTAMLVGAIARVEAAIRGDPPPQAPDGLAGDLVEIVAAIDRIAVEIAADAAPASGVSAALERIQDIAFVLHERPVEATLCDALDAAARDISDAVALPDSAAERARGAAELLRALAKRVSQMIAPSAAGRGAAPPAAEIAAAGSTEAKPKAATEDTAAPEDAIDRSAPSRAGRFDLDVEDDATARRGGDFADAVPLVAPSTEYSDNKPATEDVAHESASSEMFSSDDILNLALANGLQSRADSSGADVPSEEAASAESASERRHSGGLLPSQNYATASVESSDEDPGDLFEPMPMPSPLADPTAEATVPTVQRGAAPDAEAPTARRALGEAALEQTFTAEAAEEPRAEPRAMPPRPAGASTARAVPRPAASDPLAAVRALSEEELIALFS